MSAASAKVWRLTNNEKVREYKARVRQQARAAAAYAELTAVRPITLPSVSFLSGEISRGQS